VEADGLARGVITVTDGPAVVEAQPLMSMAPAAMSAPEIATIACRGVI
jgi:hypothetical protein